MKPKINQCEITFSCNAKQMQLCKYYHRGFETKQCMFFNGMDCINDNARLQALREELENVERYMMEF